MQIEVMEDSVQRGMIRPEFAERVIAYGRKLLADLEQM